MITGTERYEKDECGIAGSTQPGQAKKVTAQVLDKIRNVLLTHLNGSQTADVVRYKESDGSFAIRVNVVAFKRGGVTLTIGVADAIVDELQEWLTSDVVAVDNALLRVVISHIVDESASTEIIIQ